MKTAGHRYVQSGPRRGGMEKGDRKRQQQAYQSWTKERATEKRRRSAWGSELAASVGERSPPVRDPL